jgi:hypothetical protein
VNRRIYLRLEYPHFQNSILVMLNSVLVFHVHLLNTQVDGCKASEHFRSNVIVNYLSCSLLKIHSDSHCLYTAFRRLTVLECHFSQSDSSSFLNSFSNYKMCISVGSLALARVSVCWSLIFDLFGLGGPATVALRVTQTLASSR